MHSTYFSLIYGWVLEPFLEKERMSAVAFSSFQSPFHIHAFEDLIRIGRKATRPCAPKTKSDYSCPSPLFSHFPLKATPQSPPSLPSLFPYPFPLCGCGGSDLFFSGNPRSQKERCEPGVNRRGSRENGLSVRPPPSADRQPVRGWMDPFPPPPLILLSLLLIILPSRAQALLVLLPTLFQVWLFIKVFFIQSSPAIETANRSSNSPQSIGIVFERGRHPHRHPNRGAVGGSLR